MPTLLQIKSSLFSDQGQSTRLADQYVAQWRSRHPDGRVVVRDLASDPVPHLDGARVAALFTPEAQRTPAQRAIAAESDALIDELREADAVVLGVPMYNFGVPSQLKAWIDHIARAGVTFRYTPEGPRGLLDDKPVFVFAARGGIYAATGDDHQTPFLKQFFGLVGLTKVRFVYAEGLNMGEQQKVQALQQAEQEILALAQATATAA